MLSALPTYLFSWARPRLERPKMRRRPNSAFQIARETRFFQMVAKAQHTGTYCARITPSSDVPVGGPCYTRGEPKIHLKEPHSLHPPSLSKPMFSTRRLLQASISRRRSYWARPPTYCALKLPYLHRPTQCLNRSAPNRSRGK